MHATPAQLWQLTKLTVQAWLANRATLIPVRRKISANPTISSNMKTPSNANAAKAANIQPPAAGEAAQVSGLQVLDTYPARLMNETPSRMESVTEIQDRERGLLLCYANPSQAAFIVRACNAHAGLVEALNNAQLALRTIASHYENQHPELGSYAHAEATKAYEPLRALHAAKL